MTAGNLRSHKSKKGHTPTHIQSHSHSHTLSFFCPLGVCRCHICDPFLLVLFILPLSFSSLLHSFLLSRQYKGVFRPVPFPNPPVHLGCVSVCVCFSKYLSLPHRCLSPVFPNLSSCVFIALVLSDILPLFSIPLYFEVAGKLVFRSVGIAIASPSQLESGAHSNAHTHRCSTHSERERITHMHIIAHLLTVTSFVCMIWATRCMYSS